MNGALHGDIHEADRKDEGPIMKEHAILELDRERWKGCPLPVSYTADSCCYTNRDLERKEVRFNMGWFVKDTVGRQ